MKVAILGATGMLGSMLVDYLGEYFELTVTTRRDDYKAPVGAITKYLDAETCANQEILDAVKGCDWVINAIGIIKQKLNYDRKAVKVNTSFPHQLQKVTKKLGSQVIQIATDCVFDGNEGNYSELSDPYPHDIYGRTKKYGEVKAGNFYNLRCSIVGLETGKPYSLLGWFLNQRVDTVIDGYINHLWNGVTTLQFAKVCRGIIIYHPPLSNNQHLIPAGIVSKYELLKIFADAFNRNDIFVNPIRPRSGAIDRTLITTKQTVNKALWLYAGYTSPPTIEQMVMELAEWRRKWQQKRS